MVRDKHVLPATAPQSADVDYRRLRGGPSGPWDDDRWVVIPGVGDVRRTHDGVCAVDGCDGDHAQLVDDLSLCFPHLWQWRRAGQPAVNVWLPAAKTPQQRQRSNGVSERAIRFDLLPPLVSTEIRYVVGTKVDAGEWTPNRALLRWLEHLVTAVERERVDSLLDRRPGDWSLLIQQSTTKGFRRDAMSYSRTFFATLHRALVLDPWADDKWLWKGCFDGLVHRNGAPQNGQNIDWSRVAQPWLREPVKAWAKECLTTGTRAWATIRDWCAALRNLSTFLDEEGIDAPALLDRSVFLDYLVSLNDAGAASHVLAGVNQIAAVLAAVQAEVDGTKYGSPVFLRYGENVIPKKRQPKPYPADVVERIDRLVLPDSELEPAARMMLHLTRWGGLRISELVTLPPDSIHHHPEVGYWIEYLQHKTKNLRAFPIPEDLAEDLVAWRGHLTATYGDGASFLFPSPSRSSVRAQRVVPWSPGGFRVHVAAAFARNGITHSTKTGESITGGEIHRYRHTVGTALLNSGWTQSEVQDFLGHESPTMTSNYAAILKVTLSQKVREFREKSKSERGDSPDPGVASLKARFAYALPDGGCTLPANMSCETRDNPCSGCAFFDGTGPEVKDIHENRRKRLKVLVEGADSDAVRNLNQRALADVERLLGAGKVVADDSE